MATAMAALPDHYFGPYLKVIPEVLQEPCSASRPTIFQLCFNLASFRVFHTLLVFAFLQWVSTTKAAKDEQRSKKINTNVRTCCIADL